MSASSAKNISPVYIIADNIISPLGNTTETNVQVLLNGKTGIKVVNRFDISPQPLALSLFDDAAFAGNKHHTKFEQLLIESVTDALGQTQLDAADENTILIISSTKGNISLLETEKHTDELYKRISLPASAQLLARHFGFKNLPIIISNACISGVMAILTGMRLIQSGRYTNAIITGADVVSKFVLAGFQSFQALSPEVCRPFDKDRVGLNLGEGAATVILSSQKQNDDNVQVRSGAISNDANHISGPSRTGEELGFAIKKALLDAGISANNIDYISAHGTATNYNDEMEANALHHAGVQHAPVNSLKGYYGHTLGAAGLIESVIAIQALKKGLIFPSLGYARNGVSKSLNVCTQLTEKKVDHVLKTASGFGGCNAALVFSK